MTEWISIPCRQKMSKTETVSNVWFITVLKQNSILTIAYFFSLAVIKKAKKSINVERHYARICTIYTSCEQWRKLGGFKFKLTWLILFTASAFGRFPTIALAFYCTCNLCEVLGVADNQQDRIREDQKRHSYNLKRYVSKLSECI